MINLIRTLVSIHHIRTDGWCKHRDGNCKTEPKRNAGDQKCCNKRWKKNLWWAYYRLVTTDEGTSEFEGISIEAPKFKKKKKDTERDERNRTDIQEQWDNYKRCTIHIVGILTIEKEKKRKK